jgi:excisionase family DNA binding protein
MSNGKTYLNVKSASLYLGVSRGVLYKMVLAQAIPNHKIGQKILFIREELDEWIERKTLREKEENVDEIEKLLRRLDPFWEKIPLDTRAEINERIRRIDHWTDFLVRVVEFCEQKKGNFVFNESDCLLKKESRPVSPEKTGPGTEAKQQSQPTPNQKVVQARSGSSQTSGPDKPRRGHAFSVERHKKWRLARAQRRAALATSKPNDSIKGNPPQKESPAKSETTGVKTPAQEEKALQIESKPQETVSTEHPSNSTALPSDQPGGDPVSHDQTVDPLDPNMKVKKGEEENDNKETPHSN